MNKHRLLAILLTLGCMINLTGCSRDIVKAASGANVQERAVEAENVNKGKKSDGENDRISQEELADIISEDDTLEKIVDPAYEEVERYLDEESAYKGFQGVALVAQGNEIKFAKAYGNADYDDNIVNKVNTRFAIASNTKQFTAVAIMQLMEDGKINLDDTIDKYFPKFKYANQITVRELLQMRSGLVDYLNAAELYFKDEESLKILNDYREKAYFDEYVSDSRWTADIILNNLYLSELQFEPGQAYDYCNTNYYLLGLIIEQASGVSYEDYIKENIFKPCGMKISSMSAEDTDAKGHGSVESGEIVVNPKFTFAAGNIYTNVYDLLRWERMLHTGKLLSQESYNEMITPSEDSGYGFGLIISDGIIRHSGVIDGFNSYTEYDSAKDITIIILENYDPSTSILEAKYDGAIIRGLIK
ncbi:MULTISPECIES: serine hydrolase domain-containing protein [Clostridia]|jgi:CubicO group peptidase (beta-lactamase class C family)|uniref:Beta-lactamase family protein n=4 Tax=Clostridia TaxID=186801 RepID=A0A8I0DNQ4_9CLOT|nr:MULTISPECIES: serine hydrolase domain-containing protein [Clostridia]MBC5639702.1 beta-lactamase family protein [Clostridium lentum]MBC5653935.1 beta-lactamase family protein [Blautia lenta]MEE0567905.1 serine hydrolase domain-containing protein [Clostridium sp.]